MGVAAAVVVGSAVAGGAAAAQGRRAQKRAAREETKVAAMENNRAIRQAQREARRARALVEAQGAVQGQLGSSSTIGVLSSLQTQLQGNLEYMDNASQLNANIMKARQKQADWQFIGGLAGTVGDAAAMFGKPSGLAPTQTTTTPTQPYVPNYTTTPARVTPSVSSSIFR